MNMYSIASSLLLLLVCTPIMRGQELVVGILEDIPQMGSAAHIRAIRPAFIKESGQWKYFRCKGYVVTACGEKTSHNLPSNLTWTIAFDGKSIGQITTKTYSVDAEWKEGLQLAVGREIPSIGKPSHQYDGWLGGPVLRPLVVISTPNAGDPDRWKPATLPLSLQKRVRVAFRGMYPKVHHCGEDDAGSTNSPWLYKDSEIKITKAYSSTDVRYLVQLSL